MLRENFLKAVEFASKAVGRSSYPILDTIHIKSDGTTGTATGSNGDMFLRHTFECDTQLDCCVPGKRLLAVLNASPADSIGVRQDGLKLIVEGGGTNAVFDTLETKDFPAMQMETGSDPFPIPTAAIKQVLPAVCTIFTPANAKLCGVLLDKTGFAVGYDRRRIHVAKITGITTDAIIPVAIATTLSGLSGTMSVSAKQFLAEGENWSMTGKLTELPYGNWQAIYRNDPLREIPIPVDLCENIQRAMACSNDSKMVGILFSGGRIEVPGYSVECDLDAGFPFRIDPSFLQQAIKCAGEGAVMGVTDAKSLFIIKNGDFLAGVAPLRMDQ